ncbi:MAG: uroporphyrinogen-III synthase [Candidatus Bathyarchaeota archaeon]|nr:uroporphyrinogen-III synthase [Candidatus Bathyarchaeota archaeon]
MIESPGSLSGKVVAILRPSHQSMETAEHIEKLEGIPYMIPILEITTPVDKKELHGFIDTIIDEAINTLIFLSVNSVHILFEEAQNLDLLSNLLDSVNRMKVIAIGTKTQQVLREQGIVYVTIPDRHTTDGVIECLGEDLTNSIIGIPRSSKADNELVAFLTEKGAKVHEVIAYISKAPEDTSKVKPFIDDLKAGKIDAVTFTSASTAINLITLTEKLGLVDELRKSLDQVLVAAIGPKTEGTLTDLGFRVDVVPKIYSIEAMISALALEIKR